VERKSTDAAATIDLFRRLLRMENVTFEGFLMIKDAEGELGAPPRIVVVQGWFEELQSLVPVH
jgi:hypothetical protein